MNCLKGLGAFAFALALGAVAPLWAQDQLIRAPEVEEAYNQGVQLLEEQRYPEAVAALNQAIALDGAYPDAFIAKGNALKAMEDYAGAGAAYSRALEFNANSAEAYNGRGETYMEMSPPDYNLASNDFTNALNLDRSNAAALSNLGHVLVTSGQDPANALRVLDEALALNDKDARAYRDRGMAHAQLREFEKSVADMKSAIQADPADYENYSTLASIYLFQDDYAEAAEALSSAIENYKPKKRGEPDKFISGYILRADARLKLAEKEETGAARTAALEGAVADANAVLDVYDERFPESGRALFRRGRAERMLERYSDAVDSLTKAIAMIPAGQDIEYVSDAYLFRGICWYYIGSLDLARGDFEQASSVGGGFSDPRIFLWIGYTYHRQEDYREAIDAYSEAIAKAPGFALAHINKGRAYMDLGEYSKAVESFNNAIRSEPDVGQHYYNVGMAYIQLEEYQKAVDFLNLALRKENPQPEMYRQMALALRALGRTDLADEYERQAESAASSTPTS
ncbi:MAG TPA: tetratricopeptide repeat protein [Lacipirellulaceae bacterium]|nr:tetratricopeptide repeat protein [Lacipirellulaceae bacterium]